jgi:hypothetical protein
MRVKGAIEKPSFMGPALVDLGSGFEVSLSLLTLVQSTA